MKKQLIEIAEDLIKINEKVIELARQNDNSTFTVPMGNISVTLPGYNDSLKRITGQELDHIIEELTELKNQLT